MSENHSAAQFPTTCWSRVVRASATANADTQGALEELCRDYWYPLYAFVRRKGHDPHTAQDLVQGLFTDLLQREDFQGLDPGSGRFRSFLMACCSHYLSKFQGYEQSQKRGGGRTFILIDANDAESRFGVEPTHEQTAERLFERRWALTLLDRVLANLDAEMARADKHALYEKLRPSLLGHEGAPSYRAIADALNLTEGAVKMAASRLRGRYRSILREEIGRTVADPAEIDDEIRELLGSLSA